MPSPVGHALAAISVGWAIAGRVPDRWSTWRQTVALGALAALGIVADLDLLWGRHNAETHSIGAAVAIAAVAAWRRWPLGRSRLQIAVVAFAGWASHPLLDALGSDTSPPIGIMAFWPISDAYVRLPWHIFEAISRRWWLDEFWAHNARAVAWELVYLAPVLVIAWWYRRVRRV